TQLAAALRPGSAASLSMGQEMFPLYPPPTLRPEGWRTSSLPKYHDEADLLATVAGQTPTTHYNVDPTGHGTLLMLPQHGETLTMSFVLTSPSHAVVIELDGEPGSGTLDLQTPPSGGIRGIADFRGYSFTMVGVDAISTPPPYLSFGGTFSFSTANNITGLT